MGKRQKSNVGVIVRTRDEHFEGKKNYRKPGYENKGNYRGGVVVAEHKGKLAVVKLTKGSPKGRELKDEKASKYRPFVETKDDNEKPIRFGRKFIKTKKSLSMRDVALICIDCFKGNGNRIKQNRNKVREMKGRPPK